MFLGTTKAADAHADQAGPQDLPRACEGPHQMTSVQAGETAAVHEITLAARSTRSSWSRCRARPTSSPWASPSSCPYNPDGVMNPVLVMCMGLGYLFNMYRNKPLVREGGRDHHDPPDLPRLQPRAPPELHRLLRAGAGRHHRPGGDGPKWEKQFAEDEWYRHLYRTGNAYHGVHPFYAWYWGAHGLQHAGKVIIVGGDPARRCAGSASPPPARWTTPSRSPATWSAAPPPSPTSTCRRCWSPTSSE